MKTRGYYSRTLIILILLTGAAVVGRCFPSELPTRLLGGTIYSVTAAFWTVSLTYRIGPDHTRKLMMAVGIMLAAVFVLQSFRYSLAPLGSLSERLSWFAYYVPFTFIPLLSFLAALSVERGFDRSGWDLPLITACIVLDALLLTNDLHQWFQVYTGTDERGVVQAEPGPLFYAAMAWVAFFTAAAIVTIYKRLRVREFRSRIWIPALISGTGIFVTSVWDVFLGDMVQSAFGIKPFRVGDLVLITVIFSWESVFASGLIPSNSDYEGLFSSMKQDAVICGAGGSPALRSAGSVISDEQIERAARGPYTEGDLRISSRPIRGGRIVWADDISGIERLKKELSDVSAELEESVALLRKEGEIADERAALSARKAIYEDIYLQMEPSLARIGRQAEALEDLDEAAVKAALGRLCVLGAYVKRGINLRLIRAGGGEPDRNDLELSMEESLKYLDLCGADTSELRKNAEDMAAGLISGADAVSCYDRFEGLAEDLLDRTFGKGGAL